eukprot:309225-Prymnesium_polylepis.1
MGELLEVGGDRPNKPVVVRQDALGLARLVVVARLRLLPQALELVALCDEHSVGHVVRLNRRQHLARLGLETAQRGGVADAEVDGLLLV